MNRSAEELDRHPDALVQRHEHVARARHAHIVAVRGLEHGLELLRHGKNDGLFRQIARPDGAWIDTAVAWIDENHRLGVWCLWRVWSNRQRCVVALGLGLPDPGGESGFVGRHEIDLKDDGLALAHPCHGGGRNLDGSARLDDDTRLLFGKQSVSEDLDEPLRLGACTRRQLECNVRQINDYPVGIVDGEDLSLHTPAERERERGSLPLGCSRGGRRLGRDSLRPGACGRLKSYECHQDGQSNRLNDDPS